MIKATLDELGRPDAAQPRHPRHRGRRDAPLARPRSDLRHRAGRRRARRVLRPGARTARSDRTRTRSRSSARRPTSSPRVTSSTTRASRARRRSRTCVSARIPSAPRTWSARPASSAATTRSSWIASTWSRMAQSGRDAPAQHAVRKPEEVWDRLPAEVQEQSAEQADQARRRSTRTASPRRWGSARRSGRSCRHASSRSRRSCRRDEALDRIKKTIAKTYGETGRGRRQAQLRGSRSAPCSA